MTITTAKLVLYVIKWVFMLPSNHQNCAVCCQPFFSDQQIIDFTHLADGSVQTTITATEKMQGYQGVMQGGLISTLHDTAMTHCLFAHNIQALTASLNVRFIQTVPLHTTLCVTAKMIKRTKRFFALESRIEAEGVICSTAEAKFMLDRR